MKRFELAITIEYQASNNYYYDLYCLIESLQSYYYDVCVKGEIRAIAINVHTFLPSSILYLQPPLNCFTSKTATIYITSSQYGITLLLKLLHHKELAMQLQVWILQLMYPNAWEYPRVITKIPLCDNLGIIHSVVKIGMNNLRLMARIIGNQVQIRGHRFYIFWYIEK